jgi:chromosome segregation ATPase
MSGDIMRKERDESSVDPNQPALIVTYGNTSRKRRPLDKSVLVLGRMQGCDLPLMSPDVAPVHCVIVKLADGWHIRDCSGHLGTRVNGKAVTEEALADDDHLQIGPFNFKVFLPPIKPVEVPIPPMAIPLQAGDLAGLPEPRPEDLDRLKRSRTNLARLALTYRNQAQAALNGQQELKAQLEKQVRENAAERAEIDKDWKQLEKSAQSLRTREVAFDKAEKALLERVNQLEAELAERRQNAEDEVNLLRDTVEQECLNRRALLKKEAGLLDEDRLDLDKTRAELEKAQQDFDDRLAQLEAESTRVAEKHTGNLLERTRELDERGKELDRYASALRRERQEHHDQVRQAATADTGTHDELRRQVEALTGKLAGLERDNTALREQIACMPTQSHILRIEDAALRKARDEAREQVEKLSLVADALQRENEELRKKLLEHSPAADTLVGSSPAATVPRTDLEAAEAAYAALQMQFKQLQIERDRDRSRLREQLDELRQENDLLRTPVPPASVNPPAGNAEVEELRKHVEILRQRLVEVHAQQDAERESWQEQLRLAGAGSGEQPLATEDEVRQIVAQIDLLHQENEELREALGRQRNDGDPSNAHSAALLEHQFQTLQSDLLLLRGQLHDREQELADLRDHVSAADGQTLQTLRKAIQRLEGDMKDRDALIEKLTVELDAPATAANLENSGGYERELHQFRLELEHDRRILTEQLAELQQRHADIEDAARETEVQLARERANLARERSELNRLREEIRIEHERLVRQAGTNGRPGVAVPSVSSLRDVLNMKKDDNNANGNGSRRR